MTAVARKRWELWEQDFRVPLSYGVRHVLGENGGPGAAFHALRSFELIVPICRDIERLAPDALLLNFTNPEARVLHAICHLTRVRAVGLCHGVFSAVELLARLLERPREQLEVVSAGINHFYCVLKVTDRNTGRPLLPTAMEKLLAGDPAEVPPMFRKLAEIFGVFGFPSDDHVGEYLAFAGEQAGTKWLYGQESRKVGRPRCDWPAAIESYADGTTPLDENVLRPSGELAVPILCDIEGDRNCFREAVDVLNDGPYVENLPADCVVEVPAMVDAGGVHPLEVGPLPEPLATLIRTQCTIIALVTEAYRTRSKKLLLQALLLDPLVESISAAEAMLDEMLALQEDYLPAMT